MAVLERRLAELLGKESALFFPSGTMAQQVALRLHADRRGRRTFAAHPQSHLDVWEEQGNNAVGRSPWPPSSASTAWPHACPPTASTPSPSRRPSTPTAPPTPHPRRGGRPHPRRARPRRLVTLGVWRAGIGGDVDVTGGGRLL
ncbi:beta-eliminating lyase-related protein [Nonomuraea sp. NPDC003201]